MEHCKKHPPVFYTPSFEGAKSYGDFDLSVAIDQNVQERGKRVNKITSIYGRPARQILGFMNDGLALYVNQKKTAAMHGQSGCDCRRKRPLADGKRTRLRRPRNLRSSATSAAEKFSKSDW